jgi:predicted nucleotidyltransferase
VTALIDRLAVRGLVRRDADELDRRVSRISVIVDLAEDPWSQLTRFDSDFDIAVDAADEDQCESFTELLESLTAATVERGRV